MKKIVLSIFVLVSSGCIEQSALSNPDNIRTGTVIEDVVCSSISQYNYRKPDGSLSGTKVTRSLTIASRSRFTKTDGTDEIQTQGDHESQNYVLVNGREEFHSKSGFTYNSVRSAKVDRRGDLRHENGHLVMTKRAKSGSKLYDENGKEVSELTTTSVYEYVSRVSGNSRVPVLIVENGVSVPIRNEVTTVQFNGPVRHERTELLSTYTETLSDGSVYTLTRSDSSCRYTRR